MGLCINILFYNILNSRICDIFAKYHRCSESPSSHFTAYLSHGEVIAGRIIRCFATLLYRVYPWLFLESVHHVERKVSTYFSLAVLSLTIISLIAVSLVGLVSIKLATQTPSCGSLSAPILMANYVAWHDTSRIYRSFYDWSYLSHSTRHYRRFT